MEHAPVAKYDRASLLSIAVLIILVWGFYRTYIVFFPSFDGFNPIQHFHGAMMLLWMACLIIQPLLISRKKYQLHRAIGKVSFVLAPLLIFSIFAISRITFYKVLETRGATEAVSEIALNIPGLLAFAVLYILAVTNKKQTFRHMRYMIGTGLLMIGPGLGRALIIYFQTPPPLGISITLAVVAVLGLILLIADLYRKNNPVPYLIVTTLFTLQWVLWELRNGKLWQAVGNGFAGIFF